MATTKLARMVLDGARNILGLSDGRGGTLPLGTANAITKTVIGGQDVYKDQDGTVLNLVQSQVNPVTGGITLSAGGLPIEIKTELFPENPITLAKPAGSYEHAASSLGLTLAGTYLIPVPFYGVRLHFYNLGASDIIGCTAGIAASKNMVGGRYVATEAPVQVTKGGGATFTKVAALAAAETANAIWSDTVSDVIPCVSVPRDDGGVGYLLMIRTHDPASGNTVSNRLAGTGNDAAAVNAYGFAATGCAGDKTFASWGTMVATYAIGPTIGIEILTSKASLSIAAFGDSTFGGSDSYVSGASGLTLAAIGKVTADRPVAWWNQGEAGMTSDAYMTLAEKFFASGHRPNVVAICPWSPNDADKYTQAGVTRAATIASRFLHEARKINAEVIFATPTPVGGITETQEGFRRQVVALVKDFATKFGCNVVDRDALYTDYSTAAGGWLPGMNFSTVHPTPAGYTAESALWTAVLDTLL